MAGVWAVAAVALALTTACTPDPDPTQSPTPTGFASEEEAFAAAEETYRAYVDAVNARRANDDSEVDPKAFLTGSALDADIRSDERFASRGIRIEGTTLVQSVDQRSVTEVGIELTVCLDATETRVVDEHDKDVTPADRPTVLPVDVVVTGEPGDLLISESTTGDAFC